MIEKFSKFDLIMVLSFILIFITMSCDNSAHNMIKEKMKSIEIGMTKDEVIQLLGEPPDIGEGKIGDVTLIELTYPPPRGSADSVFPTVILCKETELVVGVIIDESSESYNKRASSYELCRSKKMDSGSKANKPDM